MSPCLRGLSPSLSSPRSPRLCGESRFLFRAGEESDVGGVVVVEVDGHGGVAVADEGVEPLVGSPEELLRVDDDRVEFGDGGGSRGTEDGFDGGLVGPITPRPAA